MQENNIVKQPLGWGIIGSADGYQFSVQGIEQQLGAAKYWDLDTKIAVALPSPDTKERIPLYCVAFRKINNANVCSIIQYFSVRQQGSYRSGTFLGAFIECVNTSFMSNSAEPLLDGLKNLSLYQLRNFIDLESNAYKQDIKNQPFDSPLDELSKISNQLTPNKISTIGKKILFISCKGNGELELLSSILEQPFLSYFFENIYFSSSETICEKFKYIPDIELQDFSSFTRSYLIVFKSFVSMLNSNQLDFKKTIEQMSTNLNSIKSENSQLKQEREEFKQKIISEAKLELERKESEFMQKQEKILSEERDNIARLSDKLNKSEHNCSELEKRVALFDQITDLILSNTNTEDKYQLKINELENINQKYISHIRQLQESKSNLESDIQALNSRNKALQNKLENEENQSNQYNYINDKLQVSKFVSYLLGCLLIISLMFIGWLLFDHSDEIKRLEDDKTKIGKQLETAEKSKKDAEAESDKLKREKADLESKLSQKESEDNSKTDKSKKK